MRYLEYLNFWLFEYLLIWLLVFALVNDSMHFNYSSQKFTTPTNKSIFNEKFPITRIR